LRRRQDEVGRHTEHRDRDLPGRKKQQDNQGRLPGFLDKPPEGAVAPAGKRDGFVGWKGSGSRDPVRHHCRLLHSAIATAFGHDHTISCPGWQIGDIQLDFLGKKTLNRRKRKKAEYGQS
jgi:hypothetical protein